MPGPCDNFRRIERNNNSRKSIVVPPGSRISFNITFAGAWERNVQIFEGDKIVSDEAGFGPMEYPVVGEYSEQLRTFHLNGCFKPHDHPSSDPWYECMWTVLSNDRPDGNTETWLLGYMDCGGPPFDYSTIRIAIVLRGQISEEIKMSSETKSAQYHAKTLATLLGDANRQLIEAGILDSASSGSCQYTDLNGNSVCANNFSEFQCQQVNGTFTQGGTCPDTGNIVTVNRETSECIVISALNVATSCISFFPAGVLKLGIRNNCKDCKKAVVSWDDGSIERYEVKGYSEIVIDNGRNGNLIGEDPC